MVRSVSTRIALGLLAVTPIAGLAVYASLAHVSDAVTLVELRFKTGALHLEYSDTLERIARPMVKGGRFDGKINTAAPPRTDRLNLYVVDATGIGVPTLVCNCGYVGHSTVLCDRTFLSSFAGSINYDPATAASLPALKQVDELHRAWLSAWLIGHEIGHATLHDINGDYTKQLERRRPATRQQEEEADAFFAAHVPRSDLQHAGFVLTDFSFQLLSLLFVPKPGGAGQAVIKPSRDGIHPPWLLRSLRIARILSEAQNGVGSGEQFYGALTNEVRVSRDGQDVGTLCAAEDIRAKAAAKYLPSRSK